MKKDRIAMFIIIIFFGLSVFTSLLSFPLMEVSAQTFNCIIRRDVEIPYQFQYFSTRILANAKFEIKLTIRDNSNKKVYVRLIPGAPDPNDPAVSVDDETLTYLLGSGIYISTKTDYERIGSSEDDYEIPGFSELFFQAAILDDDWIYDFDGGDAKIIGITISSDQMRIKYLEFWDNEFRDANMHEDSQDFEDFSNLADAEWENLTPNTGEPTIINNEDVLYLTPSIPPGYPPIFSPLPYYSYPSYYGSLYPSYSSSPVNVYNYYYGNYPGAYYSSYPSGPFASFRGNLPSTFYQGYSTLYPGSYTGSFRNLFSGTYPATYGYGLYSFTDPAGGFGGFNYGFPGFVSSRNIYGFGYSPYGGFIY
ncbi:MAG: hypothetical protein ACMUIU_04225 [bacterium]